MKKIIFRQLSATVIFLVLSKSAEFFIFNKEKTSDQWIRDILFILVFFTIPLILFDWYRYRGNGK